VRFTASVRVHVASSELLEALEPADTGDVQEDVQSAEHLDARRDSALDRRGIRDVAVRALGGAARLPQLGDRLGRNRGRRRRRRSSAPSEREETGRRATDA
jgi:hypothetical protein